jgi:four helix bundle protein
MSETRKSFEPTSFGRIVYESEEDPLWVREAIAPYACLHDRTKAFALGIIRLYSALPKQAVSQVIGRQFLRSGTSVGAHHREARRARSRAEFISKLEVLLQELEETVYWLQLLQESGEVKSDAVRALHLEAEELISIFVTSVKKVKDSKI